MKITHLHRADLDPTEQIYRTLGCEFRAGSCRTHQRPNDQWRPGCPLADNILRTSKGRTR